MSSRPKSYPWPWASTVFEAFRNRYTRATDFFQIIFGTHTYDLVKLLMENQVEWERFKKIVKDLEVFIRVRQMRTIEDFTKHLLSFWLARIKNKGLITEEIEKKCLTRNHISVQLTMDEMIKGNREG
jgi:hypothetical protein